MPSKMYGVRFTKALAAEFEAYIAEEGISASAGLQRGVEILLEYRPEIRQEIAACNHCGRPVASQYVIRKNGLNFDTMECFNAYLTDVANKIVTPDVPVSAQVRVKWGDIFDVHELSELKNRQYFCVDGSLNGVYDLALFDQNQPGQVPRRCAACNKDFRLTDYSDGWLVVAKRRHYYHLNCLLPPPSFLDNFRFAVQMALQTYTREVAKELQIESVQPLVVDLDRIHLDVSK